MGRGFLEDKQHNTIWRNLQGIYNTLLGEMEITKGEYSALEWWDKEKEKIKDITSNYTQARAKEIKINLENLDKKTKPGRK